MNELIDIIDNITKYGLSPNIAIGDKETDLEANLVRLYAKYFEVQYNSDSIRYKAFPKNLFPDVIENVKSNFKDFGWYHVVLNMVDIFQEPEEATGDAIDDLSDIIYDLLQVKWRRENNSEDDALWFFQFIFQAHTQEHLLGLLKYIKEKRNKA